jgi:carbonic anhydrase
MRVDPALVLGLKPGEAVVMRNIGGRITPGLLEQLGLLGRIGEVAQEVAGGGGEFHDGPIWKIKQEIVTMMQPATS